MRWLWVALLCISLTGCDAKDATGVNIDLSQLNWQTAAIIVLALLVNPGNIAGALAAQLSKIPMAERLLRLLGLIKSADGTPDTLTQAETLESLVAIVNRMPSSPLRDEIAKLLTKAAQTDSTEVKP